MASAPAFFAAPLTARAPLPYGLLSVAEVTTESDPHWRNGVIVDGDPCLVAHFTEDLCAPSEAKEAIDGYTTYEGEPFTVYALNSCKTVGRVADAEARTQRALEQSEGSAVEQAVMTNVLAPNAVTVASGAYPIEAAIGLLEGWAAKDYGGLPILHIPRSVVSVAALRAGLQHDGDMITTFLGSPIAAGGGYEENIGPDGSVAPEGEAWLYITGAMRLTRSEIDVVPMVTNTTTNDFYSLAERTYVAVVDCLVAAVKVKLPCCETCP